MTLYHSGGLEILVSDRGKDFISFFEKRPKKFSFLISYYYIRDKHLEFIRNYRSLFKDILLDSGAFSAWTQKKTINVYNYISFLKEKGDIFTDWVALDVIGDAEGSYKNYMIMKEKGVGKAIPVFHPLFEDDSWLEKYMKETEYIGLGGMAGKGVNREFQYRRLDEVFTHLVKERPNTYYKTHGFGIGSFSLVDRYPWYTIDSSVIIQLAVRGMVRFRGKVFSVSGNKGIDLNLHFNGLPTVDQKMYLEHIQTQYDLTLDKLKESEILRYLVSIEDLTDELEKLLNHKKDLNFGEQLNLF